MAKPVVAIVGRPNVGKSTLFNRLIGERRAIVEDLPGTTRDRLYGDTDWNGREFLLVDTAGLEVAPTDELTRHVQEQVRQAVAEADVIILLTDVRSGVTAADRDAADLLRAAGKPVVLAVNKCDSNRYAQNAVEFYELGLGDPIPVSALQGVGTGDLLDAVVGLLPPAEAPPEEEDIPKIAIIGRPNVGKSQLLNALLGQARSVVSEVPGTTRDAVDSRLEVKGRPLLLIDTAGIRRRGRIEPGVEKYSVLRSLRAVSRADVVLLVIDAAEGITAQDMHVASYALEADKGFVIVVNKWDLIEKDTYTADRYTEQVRHAFKFLPDPPVVFISALTGQRVPRVLEAALQVYDRRQQRIPTARLNQIFAEAQAAHPPPHVRGKQFRIYYATQPEVNPPTFVLFVNDPKLLHFSYQRYLENQLRARVDLAGTPVRFVFRPRESDERQ
ncbi:MAG: ribosome biogenesis GTPase Der [Chloroflexota bacterium]|nr:ribosome biogenesis GTPase Der [Dehalococcoidia bacterium]MDW8254341.1 ribosome biogenesis GTPase Der [Chloroflexota bacterium]